MSKNKPVIAPTTEQVELHLRAQTKSVFQKPFTRDPCVTIATSKSDVERQLIAAQSGDVAPAYMLRNSDNDFVADPLARTCDLLRKAHAGMKEKDFKKLIRTPTDEQVYLAMYGDMKDFQRATVWQRLHKQVFDEQQAALQETHRKHQLDAKRTDQLLKGRSMQERMAEAAAKRGKVIDGG
jgi:hypothetical protein